MVCTFKPASVFVWYRLRRCPNPPLAPAHDDCCAVRLTMRKGQASTLMVAITVITVHTCCVAAAPWSWSVPVRNLGVFGRQPTAQGVATATHQQLRVPHGPQHLGRPQLQRSMPVPGFPLGERCFLSWYGVVADILLRRPQNKQLKKNAPC